MDSVTDWSALPTDVLGYITKFLPQLMEDFMAFRGVCTSWRAAATKDKFVSVSKVPLLMLAEKDGSDEREFYSLSKSKICSRIPLPVAKGKRCIDVGFGWIMTLASSGEVCLWKPFSAARIKLPNFKIFPEYKKFRSNPEIFFIEGAVLTANPSETLNFTLLVAMYRHFGFWRNGGKNWMRINPRGISMAYCSGKMYTLDFTGHILTWDPQGTDLTEPQGQVKVDNVPTSLSSKLQHYLVGSTDGELLMITRNNTGDEYFDIGANHFRVMRVDPVKGECKEIDGVGNDAIFLGNNAAVSVAATEFPGILKPNCIYFTDDCFKTYYHGIQEAPKGGGKDMGIYNVDDRSIERFFVESFSRESPPLWIFPSF